jgi:hypothetical protein
MGIEGILEARIDALAMRDKAKAVRRRAISMRKVALIQLLDANVLAEAVAPQLRRANGGAVAPQLRRANGAAPINPLESSASRIESSERHIGASVKLIALGVALASSSRRPSSPF